MEEARVLCVFAILYALKLVKKIFLKLNLVAVTVYAKTVKEISIFWVDMVLHSIVEEILAMKWPLKE